jgi:hypothetical protein
MPESNSNRRGKETPGPKKPRGRPFGSGPDNPAKHRYRQPKKASDNLVSRIGNNIEIKGVSETDDQAYLLNGKNSLPAAPPR